MSEAFNLQTYRQVMMEVLPELDGYSRTTSTVTRIMEGLKGMKPHQTVVCGPIYHVLWETEPDQQRKGSTRGHGESGSLPSDDINLCDRGGSSAQNWLCT